jgi:hypothetical protein
MNTKYVGQTYPSRGRIRHDIMAKYVAMTQFPFPDQNSNPEVTKVFGIWPHDFKTIVNVENKRRAVESGSKIWYPDIVIVDGKNKVREIGEIEIEEDITPGVLEKWKLYSAAVSLGAKGYPKLHLYVPKSREREVRNILRESGLRIATLSTYVLSYDLFELKIDADIVANDL